MAKVKLQLQVLPTLDKLQLARKIVSAMQGNPNFPDTDPPLAEIIAAIAALDNASLEAETARKLSASKTEWLYQKEQQLDNLLTWIGGFVEKKSKGDAAIIASAGIPFRGARKPAKIPARVEELRAMGTDTPEDIRLKWKPVPKTKSYMVRYAKETTLTNEWTIYPLITTKATILIQGLEPKTRYWFEVAAVNTAGMGAYSDAAVKIAG